MTEVTEAQVRKRKIPTKPLPKKPVAPVVKQTPLLKQGYHPSGKVRRLIGLVFGPPKSGKTTYAASGKNVLILNFDPDGAATTTIIGRKDITVIDITSVDQLDGIIKALHTTDRGVFAWIVVDSITFLFQLVGGKEINEAYKAGRDVRRPYGKAGGYVCQVISDLVALPDQNIMFVAHLKHESSGEDTLVSFETDLGEHEVVVAVTPMVWTLLGPAVSFIARSYRGRKKITEGKVVKQTPAFMVSLNDGDRSPAGSRLAMAGEYEITGDTLDTLASELVERR